MSIEPNNFESNNTGVKKRIFNTPLKNFKYTWIVLGFIIIVLLGISLIFYIFKNKISPTIFSTSTIHSQSTDNSQFRDVKQFSDVELGISFYFPKAWGDVKKSTTAHIASTPFDLEHRFNFSQNPLVTMQVNYLGEPEIFKYHHDYTKALKEKNDPVSEFCKTDLDFESPYSYGVCNNTIIYFIMTQNIANPPGLLTLDKQGSAKIQITKTYVISSGNTAYSPLKITVTLPELIFSGDYAGAPYKEAVDNKIRDFQKSELNKEIEQLVSSISLKTVEEQEANDLIKNYFSQKSEYSNDKIGIRFDYPSILPEPVLGEDEKSVSIDSFNLLNVVSRQDAVAEEKSAEECEGMCFGPSITADEWDLHLNILKKGLIDKEKCGNCESIVTIGDNKFLILFGEGGSYLFPVSKRYITYQRDKRYEFKSINVPGDQPISLLKFNELSDKSIMQGILKDIIGTVSFTQ